jgi:hypothetical protein
MSRTCLKTAPPEMDSGSRVIGPPLDGPRAGAISDEYSMEIPFIKQSGPGDACAIPLLVRRCMRSGTRSFAESPPSELEAVRQTLAREPGRHTKRRHARDPSAS